MPITYESQEAIPTSISGFQPDMDPHLRQTLEALEDEAFVDEGLDEDFFNDLLGDGERSEGEDVEFEFEEDGLQEDDREQDDNWQARFAKFKLDQKKRVDDGSMLDGQSEGGDTLGRLPSLSVAGAKKRRRKGGSDASGYSMSSSSMFRNEGLTRLDEQFEKVSIPRPTIFHPNNWNYSSNKSMPQMRSRMGLMLNQRPILTAQLLY